MEVRDFYLLYNQQTNIIPEYLLPNDEVSSESRNMR